MDGVLHNLRKKEKKRLRERRRHQLYLISAYLRDQGYVKSSAMLVAEAQLSEDVRVCDNIDLEMILTEYESYYQIKFNKYPTFCKKIESLGNTNPTENRKQTRIWNKQNDKSVNKNEAGKEKTVQQTVNSASNNDIGLAITVTPVFSSECEDRTVAAPKRSYYEIAKSIEDLYPVNSELYTIAETILKEVVFTNLNVRWDDVKGLESCKNAIKEAVVYPLKYPIFFNNKFSPWNGILLCGPPGTGKTMLAKAAATECNCTFFNITASSLVSKWRGDSEKYIRVLFDLAYQQSPTIIFFDEIDWIATKTENYISEPARRFRAEILARLDGLVSIEHSNIVLMAATNSPSNIDSALLRRLEKRINIELPDENARLHMLYSYLSTKALRSKDLRKILEQTEGYSGADIKMLCKQAWIIQETPTWENLENKVIIDFKPNYEITTLDYLFEALEYVKPTTKHSY